MITSFLAPGAAPRCTGRWDLFFPPDDEQEAARAIRARRAKRLCAACPLTAACLAWAVDHSEAGTWGGVTEDERRLERRREMDRARYKVQGRRAA
jgi:WhiB family transcriptional regulator, redox-sensing transcriptional regulator